MKFADLSWVPSPLEESTNASDIEQMKIATRIAVEHYLTHEQRWLIVLHYQYGMTKTQLAKMYDTQPSTICKRLQKAIKELQIHTDYALKVLKEVQNVEAR